MCYNEPLGAKSNPASAAGTVVISGNELARRSEAECPVPTVQRYFACIRIGRIEIEPER